MECLEMVQNEDTGFLELTLAKIPRDQMLKELTEAYEDSGSDDAFDVWLFNMASSNFLYSEPARYYLRH